MLILGHDDVRTVLDGARAEILEVVAEAYREHDRGASAVPHSVFLRFPGDERNRVIGLPAYLGGEEPVAGMKWIASFPGNVAAGRPRASAAMILNSMRDGTPEALLEASLISAQRTGASAALAAGLLAGDRQPDGLALLGLGPINLEVLRYTAVRLPSLNRIVLHDPDRERAEGFAAEVAEVLPDARVSLAGTPAEAMASAPIISLATNAAAPHIDLTVCQPGATVLHVSLRDLTVPAIIYAQNLVDDADHVCRERTSLHLAELQAGGRDFIDAEIGAVLRGASAWRRDPERTAVFSPFGLGVLDLAVARWVRERAERGGLGVRVDGFLPGVPDHAVPTPAR